MCISPLLEIHVTMKDACKTQPEGTFMVVAFVFDFVFRIKELVAEALSVELPEDGVLMLGGEVIDDNEKLAAYGLTNGSSLDFIFGAAVRNEDGSDSDALADSQDDRLQHLEVLLASINKLRTIEKMVDQIDHRFVTPPSTDLDTTDQEACDDTYVGRRPLVDPSGQQWLKTASRKHPGKFYYANPMTGQTSWKRPWS